MPRNYQKVKTEKVANRIAPPDSYLDYTIDWVADASDDLFDYNTEAQDIYSWLAYKLGDWITSKGSSNFMQARKAAMLEILRTLGAMESSFNWPQEYDRGGDGHLVRNWSAGLWQIAPISLTSQRRIAGNWACEHHGYLSTGTLSENDIVNFRQQMKTDKDFAVGYTIRVLRQTYKHHGPLRRKHHHPTISRRSSIHPFLSLEAAEEFYGFLS
jgi:hypothetical protein